MALVAAANAALDYSQNIVNVYSSTLKNGKLMLQDSEPGAYINVSFTQVIGAYDAPVTVKIIASTGVRVSRCFITFDHSNYNKLESVFIDGQALFEGDCAANTDRGGLTNAAPCIDREYKITFSIESSDYYNNAGQNLGVVRRVCKGNSAIATGDPHFLTFDGTKFDFQGQGYYYLIKSDRLIVQAFLVCCKYCFEDRSF